MLFLEFFLHNHHAISSADLPEQDRILQILYETLYRPCVNDLKVEE